MGPFGKLPVYNCGDLAAALFVQEAGSERKLRHADESRHLLSTLLLIA